MLFLALSCCWALFLFAPGKVSSARRYVGEADTFPNSEVLNESPPQSSARQVHEVRVQEVSPGCLEGVEKWCSQRPQERQGTEEEEEEEEFPGLGKQTQALTKEKEEEDEEEVEGPIKLKVDDKNGLLNDDSRQQKQEERASGSVPKLCSSGVPCKRIDSKVKPSSTHKDGGKKQRSGSLKQRRFLTREKRAASAKEPDSGTCEHRVSIQAFGSNYTLCLFLKNFKDEPILEKVWPSLNVTVFGSKNSSEDVAISKLNLHYASGFVLGEDFTSVSGFLMDDHFYGTVYMRDTVHYLEPHNRKSRDMHIFGDGLKTLLHKHEVKDSPELSDHLPGGGGGRKPGQPQPQRRVCDLTIVADHLFFAEVGESNLEKTLLQMLWHVKEANSLFQSKDFDDDGQSECIGFTVSEITVFKTADSAVNLLTGDYAVPEDFLKRFSRYNFDGFCLGILFTNRAFTELVLGLSWRGNPKPDGVGGICQSRVRIKSDKNAYSFNALFISLKSSQEDRIPLRMGVLNLVHEMMHSFGAKHDPEITQEPECTPKDKWVNGRYLMSKYSNDGHKLNHEILSPCTKKLVCKNLESTTRVTCLIKVSQPFCGDGIVQTGEDCDCGTIFQCIAARSCCVPPEGGGDKRPCTLQRDVTACVS